MLILLPKGVQTKLLKFFCLKVFSICHRCRWHRWQTLTCEYLREFSKKFETVSLEYSGAGGKLIHEKNQKQKFSWHCPFKVGTGESLFDDYRSITVLWHGIGFFSFLIPMSSTTRNQIWKPHISSETPLSSSSWLRKWKRQEVMSRCCIPFVKLQFAIIEYMCKSKIHFSYLICFRLLKGIKELYCIIILSSYLSLCIPAALLLLCDYLIRLSSL
jgi:hypothetical protein